MAFEFRELVFGRLDVLTETVDAAGQGFDFLLLAVGGIPVLGLRPILDVGGLAQEPSPTVA
jgi:hypothetical protein